MSGRNTASTQHSRASNSNNIPEDEVMEDVRVGIKCEIKNLERRYTSQGEAYLQDIDQVIPGPMSKHWWCQNYALCRISYSDRGVPLPHWLYVNAPPLRGLLSDVLIPRVPGFDPVNGMVFVEPFYQLFYYREQLKTEGLRRFNNDDESMKHVNLLLNWIRGEFQLQIKAFEDYTSNPRTGVIAFPYLWTLFPPRTIVCNSGRAVKQAHRVKNCFYEDRAFVLQTERVGWDGGDLGMRDQSSSYQEDMVGPEPINLDSKLGFTLLDFMEDADKVRDKLYKRGRKFENCIRQKFHNYNGVAIHYEVISHIEGRIILDDEKRDRMAPNCLKALRPLEKLEGDGEPEPEPFRRLTDEEAILAPPRLRGFSLITSQGHSSHGGPRKLYILFIDSMSPVEWKRGLPINLLVIGPGMKQQLLRVLETGRRHDDVNANANVNAGRKGMICILSGPSGVGKTTTAVSMAEYSHRPLYTISAQKIEASWTGDLEAYLADAMCRAARWGVILLVEEADELFQPHPGSGSNHWVAGTFTRVLHRASQPQQQQQRDAKGATPPLFLFLTTRNPIPINKLLQSGVTHTILLRAPDEPARRQMWYIALANAGFRICVHDPRVLELARKYQFSGWDIQHTVMFARRRAVSEGHYNLVDFDLVFQIAELMRGGRLGGSRDWSLLQ